MNNYQDILLCPHDDERFYIQTSAQYYWDWQKTSKSPIILVIGEHVDVEILERGFPQDQEMIIEVLNGANLKLNLASLDKLGNGRKKIMIHRQGNVQVAHADFSFGNSHQGLEFILQEEGATAYYHLASLASGKDQKIFDVSFAHLAEKTSSKVDSYGVVEDKGSLHFVTKSKIIKGAKKTQTRQNGKIMVFDEKCAANVQPILEIDENDIEASHAAAVGKVNDEHLFYLTSRGISENEAKRIITLGYLKPILRYFINEDIKEEIQQAIERRI